MKRIKVDVGNLILYDRSWRHTTGLRKYIGIVIEKYEKQFRIKWFADDTFTRNNANEKFSYVSNLSKYFTVLSK